MPAKKKPDPEQRAKKRSQPRKEDSVQSDKIEEAEKPEKKKVRAFSPSAPTPPAKKQETRDADPKKRIPPSFSPEIRARLAIDLLKMEEADVNKPPGPNILLSDDLLERSFLDKLRQANILLNAAAGLSEETVHAYQLFREDTDPISFREIARRFAEAKWPKLSSHNTIENHVRNLLDLAHTEIQVRQEYYQERLSLKMGYPTTLQNLEDKIEFGLNKLLDNLDLTKFLSHPADVVENATKHLMKLMGKGLAEAKFLTSEELHESMLGYHTFLSYVCNDLSYERFISSDHLHIHMDLEDLASVIYFFENLSESNFSKESIGRRIGMLIGPVLRTDRIPSEIVDKLALIQKMPISGGRVEDFWQNHIDIIVTSLKAAYENWRLEISILYSSYNKIEKALSEFHSNARKVDQSLEVTDMRILSEMLRNLPSRDNLHASVLTRSEGLRGDLKEIIRLAEGVRDSISRFPAIRGSENLIDSLGKMHDMLQSSLSAPSASDLEQAPAKLRKLFKRLTPYSGSRLVRPYELFLFAAQERHLVKELTITRSRLNEETFPNPLHKSRLSILWAHRGARFSEDDGTGPNNEPLES